VMIVDDVITDGASKREAADLIRAVGAEPVGVAITMDRQERARDEGEDRRSGVQYVEQTLGLKVIAIATLADLMQLLATTGDPALAASKDAVAAYRARYGIDA
jgi:orotate phosphoribosyltransferase